MSNIYAVVNPKTQIVVGFVETNINIKEPISVESLSLDTVNGETHKLHNMILSNEPTLISQYDEKRHFIPKLNCETYYYIVLEGKNLTILKDTSTITKLEKAMYNLETSKKTKDILIDLAFNNAHFILKSMKEKPLNKIHVGDVILDNDKLLLVSALNDDGTSPNTYEFVSSSKIKLIETQLVGEYAFRVGRIGVSVDGIECIS